MISALRQCMERHKEYNAPLYLAFLDLNKAYDSVSRKVMWVVMRRFGVPPNMAGIIESFHEDMEMRVRVEGECTVPQWWSIGRLHQYLN